MSMDTKSIAEFLIKYDCFKVNLVEPFTYASGLKGPIYCDNRKLISHPDARLKVTEAFCTLIKNQYPQIKWVAAMATSGIPFGAWVAQSLNKPLFYVRSSPKGHGQKRLLEGDTSLLDKSTFEKQGGVLIEDLVNAGSSSLKGIQGIKESGGTLKALLSIVDYQRNISKEAFKGQNCPFYSLVTMDQLLDCALSLGKMSSEDRIAVDQWRKLHL